MNTFEWDFEQTSEKLQDNSKLKKKFIKYFYFHQIIDGIKILVIDCQETIFWSFLLSNSKEVSLRKHTDIIGSWNC